MGCPLLLRLAAYDAAGAGYCMLVRPGRADPARPGGPPGLPAERTAALRAAFDAAIRDRDFVEMLGKAGLPLGGRDLDRWIAAALAPGRPLEASLLQAAERGGAAAGAADLVRRLASSGFADTSRIGGGNPELGTLMARCNRTAVLQALAGYRRQLEDLEALVQAEAWEPLQEALSHCQTLRPEFL